MYQQQTRTVFSAGNGEVEIYEFAIPDEWDGYVLAGLLPQQGCVMAALTRAGQAFLPNNDTRVKSGDIILVSATLEGSEFIRQQLSRGPILNEMRE